MAANKYNPRSNRTVKRFFRNDPSLKMLYDFTKPPSLPIELNSLYWAGDQKLVGYWRMEGNSNTTGGTASNGTDTSMSYGTSYGKFGQGASFNGTTSKITGTVAQPTYGYTVMGWIKFTGTVADTNYRIWDTQESGTPTTGLVLAYNPSLSGSTKEIRVYHNDGSWASSGSLGSTFENDMAHFAVTWDGATARFYVNGVLKKEAAYTTAITNGGNYDIGHGRAIATYWAGNIDDLMVLGYPLSSNAIASVANNAIRDKSMNQLALGGEIFHWGFEGNSNSNIGDLNGTDTSVTYGTSYGKIDQGASFNGTTSKIALGNPAALQIGKISISVWIKTSGAGSSYRDIIQKSTAWSIGLKDNVLMTYEWGGAGDKSTGTNLADSAWHHVVMTLDSGVASGFKFYVDGTLNYTSTYTCNSLTGSNCHIGAEGGSGGSEYFNGYIDELTIFNRVITADEVAAIYAAQGAGKTFGDPSAMKVGAMAVKADTMLGTAVQNFDGSADYMKLRKLPVTGDPVTISVLFWFKTTATARGRFFDWGASGVTKDQMQIEINQSANDGLIACDFATVGAASTGAKLNDGLWHLAVITIPAGASRNFYIDGKFNNTNSTTGLKITETGTIVRTMGRDEGGATQYLNADLGEVAVFNRALSLNEISAYYRYATNYSFFDLASLKGTITSTLTESITITDTLIRSMARNLTESAPVTDVLTTLRVVLTELVESVAVVDTLVRSVARNVVEALSITDVLTTMTAHFKTLTDAITHTDVLTYAKVTIRTFTEALTIVDRLVTYLNGLIPRWATKFTNPFRNWTDKY